MPAWTSQVPWWVIAAAALLLVIVAISGLRTLLARRPPSADDSGSGLHNGYLVATALIAASALLLITVAFTMSYAALYESATWLAHTQLTAINGGDLRFLFPLGIDAVIVYFLAMDLVMEWQGRRHPLNRWSAYGLSAITIVLNVSQGEGTTSSYLGHAGPPVVIILIAEGVAAWVRHLAGLAHGKAADRIPAGRWIAHPVSTLKVARLMLGSGIISYPDALEREQQRQLAYAMLREQYARRWRRATPRHLKWMLDNGYDLPTAFRIIRAMTASRVAMNAEEAHALQGDAARPQAPAAPAADGGPWRAVAVPEYEHADAGGRTADDRSADGGASSAPDSGEDGSAAVNTSGERAHTPVFQAPGPMGSRQPEAERAVATEEEPAGPGIAARPSPEEAAAPAAEGAAGPEPPERTEAAASSEQAAGEAHAAPADSAQHRSGAPSEEAHVAAPAEPATDPADAAGPDDPAQPVPRRNSRPISRATAQERKQQVRNLMETVPDIGEEEIAGYLGVGTRTVRKYRNEILATASADGYRVEEGEDGHPRLVQTAHES